MAALAVCLAFAAASCVPVDGYGIGREAMELGPRPVAAFTGALDDNLQGDEEGADSREAVIGPLLPPGVGVRGGMMWYPVTNDWDVTSFSDPWDPRYTWGAYYHFAEKETQRLEGSLSYCWDTTDGSLVPTESENHAYMAGLNYVSYLGTSGFFYWSVGGGAIIEALYDDSYFFGYLEAATGYWAGSGQKGLDIRLGMQTPIGRDLNAVLVIFLTVGYDI